MAWAATGHVPRCGPFPGRHHVSEEIDMVMIENLDHAPRPTRREFTREALRSLPAVALIEGLAAHRLQGQRDVRLIEFFAGS